MKSKAVSRAEVYVRALHAGALERTTHGARFTYDAAYLAQHGFDTRAAVASTLPMRAAPHDVLGTNLHPYFAGLLPEGLRLRALVRAVKTSEDDLFSLLLASGSESIGAVHVLAAGDESAAHIPSVDVKKLEQVRFGELLENSLRFDTSRKTHTTEASFAGAQPKLSAGVTSFPIRTSGSRRAYLLKLNPSDYPRLVQNEAFFMTVAKAAGLPVANVKLVSDASGESGLLVERFDRVPKPGTTELDELAQEDVCQLLGRYPADKYLLTLADAARALTLVSSAPTVDILRLIEWQAFAYVIANGDLHAKNISVQWIERRVQLTPAYDVLSTLPYGDGALALAIDGRDKRLKAKHFVTFGERHGVLAKATATRLQRLCARVAPWIDRLDEIGLPAKETKHLERTMRERLAELAG